MSGSRRSGRHSGGGADFASPTPPARTRPNQQLSPANNTAAQSSSASRPANTFSNRLTRAAPTVGTPLIYTSIPALMNYDAGDLDSMIGAIVRYILLTHNSGKSIKLSDITANVMKGTMKGAVKYLVSEAKRRLLYLFGYELVELEKFQDTIVMPPAAKKQKTAASSTQSQSSASQLSQPSQASQAPAAPVASSKAKPSGELSSTQQYTLRLAEDRPVFVAEHNQIFVNQPARQEANNAKVGVIWYILALIQTKGQRCPESVLFRALETAQLDDSFMKAHESIFGTDDLRHFIQITLTKQHYLKREAIEHAAQLEGASEDDKFAYLWGPRAYAESTPLTVYDSVCQHLMDRQPDPVVVADLTRKENMLKEAKAKPAAAPPAAQPASQPLFLSQPSASSRPAGRPRASQ